MTVGCENLKPRAWELWARDTRLDATGKRIAGRARRLVNELAQVEQLE